MYIDENKLTLKNADTASLTLVILSSLGVAQIHRENPLHYH